MSGLGSVRERRSATRLDLSEEQLHILLHSLGIQRRGGKWSVGGWRNHFCAGPGSENFMQCKRLARRGWMVVAVGAKDVLQSESEIFHVSEAGRVALRLAGWKMDAES